MNNAYDVIVIGGGAAGLMAAGRAAERGRRVLLLEKNRVLGKKLSVTGGGRCNITNAEEDDRILLKHFGHAEKFLYSSFSQFSVADTFTFFAEHGLPLVVQANKRAFPKTEKATDVVRVLQKYVDRLNVEIRTNAEVTGFVSEQGKISGVNVGHRLWPLGHELEAEWRSPARGGDDEVLSAESYILATGGKSHPETGSTGEAFGWLSKLGLVVKEPTPTIVPIGVKEQWIKSLAGVALNNVKIIFFADGQKKFNLEGRILCTHFGLSGPLILNAAGKVADLLHSGTVTAMVDVHPEFDLGSLDRFVTDTFDANKNKELKNVMRLMVPTGTAPAILTLLPNIDHEKKVHSVTKTERKNIVQLLKNLPVTVTGLMGYERAVVADGGLSIREVDGKTMRARKFPNLFVTGDVLDISRPSGGYSLQLCWTTGWVAGNSA